MRTTLPLVSLLLGAAALPLAAQTHDQGDPDHPAQAAATAGQATAPAGWAVRADGKADAATAKIAAMGQGLHITTGPAVILYREDTKGSGPFHTLAKFTQTKPS
ncbi:MAG TPA: hypothetical protein VFT84_11795, partial [Gemmatimonadales bacterium]|nr:hypothetical protein [Gemmatimonadales bacterium]